MDNKQSEQKILYTYGMPPKKYSINFHPTKGLVIIDDDILDEYYGILYYDRKLPEEVCEKYELDYLGKRRLRE